MASKKQLHAEIEALSTSEAKVARIVIEREPEPSIAEVRKRLGTRAMSPEEFDRHFGHLPSDGEG
ncbi:MAG TPA: hypothetical protein VFP23_02395 [Solirubrobacterales bacterium]|nr:hypothetical protein [Solirubrobacterales bacterium]